MLGLYILLVIFCVWAGYGIGYSVGVLHTTDYFLNKAKKVKASDLYPSRERKDD